MSAVLKSLADLAILRPVVNFACSTCADTGLVLFHERSGCVNQPCRDCNGAALRREKQP